MKYRIIHRGLPIASLMTQGNMHIPLTSAAAMMPGNVSTESLSATRQKTSIRFTIDGEEWLEAALPPFAATNTMITGFSLADAAPSRSKPSTT